MGIIQQNSRISFHTITATGASFSVPTQEDFTSKTSPWSIYDLCLSEIGVNEGDEKAYIRIGSSIKEFEFVGATSGAESLSDTLTAGNTTGANDIIIDLDRQLKTTDTGYIQFGDTGADLNAILIRNGGDGITTPANAFGFSGVDAYFSAQTVDISGITDTFILDPALISGGTSIKSEDTGTGDYTQTSHTPTNYFALLTDTSGTFSTVDLTTGNVSIQAQDGSALASFTGQANLGTKIAYDNTGLANTFNNYVDITNQQINIWTTDATIATSSYIILNRTDAYNPGFDAYAEMAVDNTVRYDALLIDPSNLNIGDLSLYSSDKLSTDASLIKLNPTEIKIETSAVGNFIKANTLTTSAAGTYSISTLPTLATSNSITIKARVIGFSALSSLTYGSDLFAVFANYGGTVTQISTTDIIEKTDFGAGWTSDIETDGTDIFIKVKANGTDSTSWKVMYEYITA
jgi:hypothetical protein